ncbi:ROK family protein [Paenibacillus lutimineralis]|uniref:ROK family protein n=2 Tax=Paenibacillus lutimineralis TaxID=2707005 RepID=A0A3Q9IC27_9BACL|nr:ROK family protein [Paenibacillus lutimineralis]
MLRQFMGITSQKTKNLKVLYGLIRQWGPIGVKALSEMTGYKPTTCARLLDELVHVGLIHDSGLGESSGGRKPLMYVIHPDAFYLIGVEISNLYTTVLLLDLDLTILGTEKLKMNSQCTAQYTLDYVSRCIKELLAKHNIPTDKMLGIGVGVLDPVDLERGIIVDPHLFPADGWNDFNIVEYLEKNNDTLVFLDNGTNLAALAEYRLKYWKETDSLVFVSSDMGIRSSMIIKGKLVHQINEMDDALSHMIIDIHGRRCSCGAYGCLQTYSSLPAIHHEVIHRLKRGQGSILQESMEDVDKVDFHHILEAMDREDSLCLEVVKEAAYYFGIGLANLIFLLRPDIVICGGTLVPKPLFYEEASRIAHERVAIYPNCHVKIVQSSTAYNIVAQGAGCMVLDHFTSTDINNPGTNI